jgi:hypothetical protein
MSRPVYDCGAENCGQCRRAFRSVEGLTALVLEEARAVISAEADLQEVVKRHADRPAATDEQFEKQMDETREAEQDLVAMVVRLANAMGKLDAFQSQPVT